MEELTSGDIYKVGCPSCGAKPHDNCQGLSQMKVHRADFHKSRRDAAAVAKAQRETK